MNADLKQGRQVLDAAVAKGQGGPGHGRIVLRKLLIRPVVGAEDDLHRLALRRALERGVQRGQLGREGPARGAPACEVTSNDAGGKKNLVASFVNQQTHHVRRCTLTNGR